jgi:Holliday junction DNA helicase RuvA
MITSIRGTLTESALVRAVVEVDGFGYEVHVPVTTAERLPSVGSTVKLHTLVIYREDSQTLYGFAAAEDRDFFRLMIENVTGIGPKMALSIMSRLSLPLLQGAIRSGDIAALAKCPGIGKKTAERLVVELKGRVGSSGGAGAGRLAGGPGRQVAPFGRRGGPGGPRLQAGRRRRGGAASVAQPRDPATTESLIRKALG